MDSVFLEIDNCIDCPNHGEVRDPDPEDSFCNDDMAVMCMLKEPEKGERFPRRAVTSSCRPYRLKEECEIPKWCPLRKQVH